MPDPIPLDASIVSELSRRQYGRPIGAADAAAVAALLAGLDADMQSFRNVAIADAEEPATTYSALEGG